MRKSKLQAARDAHELAKLMLETKRMGAILAKYDATEPSVKRRQPVRETKDEGGVYRMRERWKGCSIGRDLERNYSPARGILHQFRMNVVGPLGKLKLNIEGGDEAAAWFNGEWAKDCDFRDTLHWSTNCQNVVASVIREGDLLAVFDDGLVEDSGKLLHWESDQVVPLSDNALKGTKYGALTQDNGLLRDKWGRVVAYIATGKHGQTIVDDAADVTFWPREQARLVKNPWRLNQGRGVPAIITSATNFLDLYEMLAKELQSAKVSATLAGYTKRANATTDWDDPGSAPQYLPENEGKTSDDTDAESAGGGDSDAPNYERFESLTGGLWEYLDPQDDIGLIDPKRPNVHMLEFIESVLGFSGASLGMARAYTLLRADSSYTSFRGDMVLTWAGAFYPMQKWLERDYADWVALKALAWGQRKGKFGALPVGWEKAISWQWPVMPSVDEGREATAEAQRLKNGTVDFSDLLGPDWSRKFETLAAQLDKGRELNLPLSVFEQKSGGMAGESSNNDGGEQPPEPDKDEPQEAQE